MIGRNYLTYLERTVHLIGRIGCGLYLLSILASLALSVIEYSVAIFLMVFLFTLGFVDFSSLPGWLPFDVRTLSPFTIWIFLFLIMALRGGLQIINYQSRILLTERTQSRLRLVLGYMIFMKQGTTQLSLSKVNLYFGEFFPKAISFIFHFTIMSSFLVQSLMISAGMFYFARGETLVGLGGLAIMGVFVLMLNRYTHRTAKRVPRAAEALERTKVRVIRNWLLIKILRTEYDEYKRYATSVLQYYRHKCMAYLIANSGTSIIPMLGVIVIAVIVFANAQFFNTPGVDLVAFLYLFFRFQQMMAQGSAMMGDLFTCRVQFRESIQLISRIPRVDLHTAFRPAKGLDLISGRIDLGHVRPSDNRRGAVDGPPKVATHPPSIKVIDVTFTWPETGVPVLKNFNLIIPQGSQAGLIGPNGSGKSTLLAIITGVLKPDAGCVRIDDITDGEYLQRHSDCVSYVGPEPFLIEGTIRQNLTYGCSTGLSDEQLLEALDQVYLGDFIASLKEGLGYAIDENGAGLSSGQKQRLTIARALLRRPKLLILDEPTANIDKQTETLLTTALSTFKGRCTTLIVSHKPELLRHVDLIVEMGADDGTAKIRKRDLG